MPADFSQVRSLAADLAEAGPQAVAKAQKVIVKIAYDIEGTGKQLAAVDTGAMRNSIGVDVGKLEATIGPTMSYSPYVEFGTSRMAPQPFMGPALDRHVQAFLAAMDQVVGDIL